MWHDIEVQDGIYMKLSLSIEKEFIYILIHSTSYENVTLCEFGTYS